MDEREFISLHDSGDRTVIVGKKGNGQRLYKVSSLVMAMASPHWRAMFNPASGFLESEPNVAVEFPDDDPDALLLLLRIAHLQFNELPQSLPFKWLKELAVLCDKYDTVGLVQPFIENWMGPWTLLVLAPGYEDWLFIAWTFGCQQVFGSLASSLILSIEVDGDGTSKNSGNVISCEDMPPGIFESILKVREETIAKLLKNFQEITESLINHKRCYSPSAHNSNTCCHIMLGFLVKALHPLELPSQKIPTTEVRISISTITQRLNEFDFSWPFGGVIRICNLGRILNPSIAKILEEVPSAVMEHHKRHMEEQAKKSGIGHIRISDSKP